MAYRFFPSARWQKGKTFFCSFFFLSLLSLLESRSTVLLSSQPSCFSFFSNMALCWCLACIISVLWIQNCLHTWEKKTLQRCKPHLMHSCIWFAPGPDVDSNELMILGFVRRRTCRPLWRGTPPLTTLQPPLVHFWKKIAWTFEKG